MASTSTYSGATQTSRRRWRVVDIVVAAVLAVACGVIFWLWSLAWTPLSVVLSFLAPLSGLLVGGWLIGGTIGALVIRKPGAALFCELVAAMVEATLGTHWGMTVLIWGVVQGASAELVFALTGYRRWNLTVATLAGAAAGLGCGLLDITLGSAVTWEAGYRLLYVVCAVVSGAVIAGVGGWLTVRALAGTGALSAFGAGRTAREV
ncbi:MAG: ECF transporter S component [Actinomycetales bacterium]